VNIQEVQLLICSCVLFDVLDVFVPAPLSPTAPGLARPVGLSLAELGWPDGRAKRGERGAHLLSSFLSKLPISFLASFQSFQAFTPRNKPCQRIRMECIYLNVLYVHAACITYWLRRRIGSPLQSSSHIAPLLHRLQSVIHDADRWLRLAG
jgi:hypothetical protein